MSEPHSDGPANAGGADSRWRRARGLRRVGATTRWTFAAAVGGSVVLGATYADAFAGSATAQAPSAPSASPVPSEPNCLGYSTAALPISYLVTDAGESDDDERGEHGREHRDDDNDERAVSPPGPVVPAPADCAAAGATSGLRPPAQPPMPANRAPQTQTGAS